MEQSGAVRRLRVTGAIAVLTIALLTIASASFLAWRHYTAPSRTEHINLSGLRRGQSVAVVYRAERLGRFPRQVPELEAAIAKLDKSQVGLMDLDPADQAFYDRFIALARSVAAHPRDVASRDVLEALGTRMYAIFYARTIDYSEHSSATSERAFETTMAGSAITLLVIVLLYAFVMRPGERVVAATLRELEERRQRFAAMFDNSSEMMAIYEFDGRIVRANNAALSRLGFGVDAVGKHYELHVAPHDRETVAWAFAQAIEGKSVEIAVDFLDSAGGELPVVGHMAPIVVRGDVVGVVGTARDMTVERKFEDELLRGRERFRSLFEASPDAVIGFTPEGVITEANLVMEQTSGYRNEELVGKNVTMLVPPEFRDLATKRIAEALGSGARSHRIEILARDGTSVALDAEIVPIRIKGVSEGVFLIGKVLTREEALQRLAQTDERMRALYRMASSPDSAAGTQIEEAIVLGAQVLGLQYGFVSRIADGIATIRHRFAPDDTAQVGERFESTPSVGMRLMASPRAISIDDLTVEPYATDMRERGFPWKSFIGGRLLVDGVPFGALLFFGNAVRVPGFEQADRDFIDLMRSLIESALGRESLEARLRDMAFHDALTGLANRALLEEHVALALAQAGRSGQLVALHYLDLNRFKPVNDEHGHAAGDSVLRGAARRFNETVRAQDVVARIGGDEFVVLQAGATEDAQIQLLAQRLRNAMAEPFTLPDGKKAEVGVSVGTAVYPRDSHDAAGLLRAADAAMYGEKTERRRAG